MGILKKINDRIENLSLITKEEANLKKDHHE